MHSATQRTDHDVPCKERLEHQDNSPGPLDCLAIGCALKASHRFAPIARMAKLSGPRPFLLNFDLRINNFDVPYATPSQKSPARAAYASFGALGEGSSLNFSSC